MKRVDFFSGETPLEDVSPPVSQEEQMANIGQYQYGGPPVNIGGIGYNNSGGYQGSPYQGIGYNYGYYAPPEYTQYGYTPQYQGAVPNPAFGMMQSNPQFIQAQDVTVDIPPFNPWGSEYLFDSTFEDRVDKLMLDYWMDQQKSNARNQMMRSQFNNGYTNYYGNQYYSMPYNYTNNNKYIEEYNQLVSEARQRRIDMNIGLSKLAHNYLGDDIDEKSIQELYTGKTVTIPGITNLDIYEDTKLRNLVPFDNSQMYRDADSRVSAEFRKRISDDANMNECFTNLGLVNFDYEMERELHRRNSEFGAGYDSNTYKTFIRQKVFDETIKKEGLDPSKQIKDMRDNLLGSGMFPTLNQSARLADDGTMNITYSYDPNQVNNLNESQYQKEKERFNSFLNAIPNAFGGVNSG